MFNQIFPYLFVYLSLVISIIGFGSSLLRILEKKNVIYNINIGYIGLVGIFFCILYSYFTSYFFPHSQIHNSIFFFIGLIFFFNNLKLLKKEEINFLIFFFLIFFIGILNIKNHDDFSYYHFPYTFNLTQFSHFIGLGNFNHGFKTPSSIFYLNSLFYLPYFKYNLFNFGAILIFGFSLIVLFLNIKNFNKKEIDSTFFLNLFSFMFIIVFFYRISEHGTDRSAQILILLFFIEILNFHRNYNNFKYSLIKLITLISIIISLKSFYILYLIFGLVILYQLYVDKKNYLILKIFKSVYFLLFLSTIFLIFFTSFLNTGCLIFPVVQSCFENYIWSIPNETVNYLNDWYEQWSKGGASPNHRVENPKNFIEQFNWVNQWINIYFFTKVSDLLGGLILLSIIIAFSLGKKKKIDKFKIKKIEILLFCTLLILFFEWFYNHPALRYGGYVLFVLIIAYPISIILEKYKLSKTIISKRAKSLIIIGCLIFVSRNIDRLINENEKYGYNPIRNVFYDISNKDFREFDRINNAITDYNNCLSENNLKNCFNENDLKVKKYLNTYIFYK